MAYVHTLFNTNFLEYASYVIKDRAIPHVDDGLKPVQRRILHSLLEVDDGKFHKVANVVGHCMKYHPHGDASIYEALVVLANKGLFIDTQGNFGNIFTGDRASAARYIECRINPIAREILWRPELTEYVESYDGRNREPLVFPAKIPLALVLGAEGIAVGMSTRILPHNFVEVIQAVQGALRGETVTLYPDFPTGGLLDVSDYAQGQGKVLVRATLDTSDEKRVVIREIPFGTTTESLIASIENAARRGKIKIAQINDYTSEKVEIEIRLPRGVYTQDVVDGLYAFTDCEQSISVNLLMIHENKPRLFTIPEVIDYHARRLVKLLELELRHEEKELLERLHLRTLERIFVEERIYKAIEEERSHQGVSDAVFQGFLPFRAELVRDVTDEDIERLLKIPIRRISRYDIERNRQEVQAIRERLEEIRESLKDLVACALAFLEGVLEAHGKAFPRLTTLQEFRRVDVREAAPRDRQLRYDEKTGYLGYGLSEGTEVTAVSPYDRVLLIDASAGYRVVDVPEKLFVGEGLLYAGLADKELLAETVFTLVYRTDQGATCLKRCTIEQFILEKDYALLPEGSRVLAFTTLADGVVRLRYKKKPRIQKLEEDFDISGYLVKSTRAGGVRLSVKEVSSVKVLTSRAKSVRKQS
ncbi:DNA topoisomerase IV [Alkalispirochaeta sphaeroplastigenens]|uniref:DNA topoisomerase IV n=1 Tax=Alkalispirochaeta sphaeroplastigenens TaxID=1187066 RepID=A0A2S4JQ16_9SPIO|nr:DNA topoisomerase IV subunit A [Alkalispirochaeta sphaeroplastigenens]POR01628.1 DNA topoisomerase IV [Alkalispirochaeta sphaeroplastigenens]